MGPIRTPQRQTNHDGHWQGLAGISSIGTSSLEGFILDCHLLHQCY